MKVLEKMGSLRAWGLDPEDPRVISSSKVSQGRQGCTTGIHRRDGMQKYSALQRSVGAAEQGRCYDRELGKAGIWSKEPKVGLLSTLHHTSLDPAKTRRQTGQSVRMWTREHLKRQWDGAGDQGPLTQECESEATGSLGRHRGTGPS